MTGEVEMRILCDTHTHTLHSRHAYSTLEENVRAAAQAGLELLGSTDHFSSMLGPGVGFEGDPDLRDYQFFINQEVWPRVWHGVTVLRGAEADIVDLDGHLFGHGFPQPRNISLGRYKHALDLDERVLGGVDYAIASVHGKGFAEGASVSETTRMYVRALENPKVLILGHIGRSGVDFDVDEVVSAARDLHKLIEINETSLAHRAERSARCPSIAQRCAELGCQISVGSDAHISCDVGRFDAVSALLDEIGFPEELVASRSGEAFLAALDAAGLHVDLGGPL